MLSQYGWKEGHSSIQIVVEQEEVQKFSGPCVSDAWALSTVQSMLLLSQVRLIWMQTKEYWNDPHYVYKKGKNLLKNYL